MTGILTFISRIDRVLAILIKPIVVVISLAVAVMLTYGIFTRAVLDAPVFGLEELVLMAAMWLYMLGAVLASRDRSHLTADFIEVITDNARVIKAVHLLATSISLFMAVMFAVWSYDLLQWGVQKGQTTPVFQLPWYLSQGSLFVASVLFIFYLIRDFLSDLTGLHAPNPGVVNQE
ncbi:TRAP transporter small permease [Marinobacter qingdaonensis]|uniref:TRAP transporter small permease protein n=1 Tax=Marinobacter qingdaonensis TaxID=3108486 RepID=A0ABU5NTD8_9GAMM|nr:TRAP transporter small permease [Marinobacter sp. ASW11-75]MEA1079069.1 TRAP transporter small permease [Marinobacter sp. ASW11-75]